MKNQFRKFWENEPFLVGEKRMVFMTDLADEMKSAVEDLTARESTREPYSPDDFHAKLDGYEKSVRKAVDTSYHGWWEGVKAITDRRAREKRIDKIAEQQAKLARRGNKYTSAKMGVISKKSTDKLQLLNQKVRVCETAEDLIQKEIRKAEEFRTQMEAYQETLKGVWNYRHKRKIRKLMPDTVKEEEISQQISDILMKTQEKKENYVQKVDEHFESENQRREAVRALLLEAIPGELATVDRDIEDWASGKPSTLLSSINASTTIPNDKKKLLRLLLKRIKTESGKVAAAFEGTKRRDVETIRSVVTAGTATTIDTARIFNRFEAMKPGNKVRIERMGPEEWVLVERKGNFMIFQGVLNPDNHLNLDLTSKKYLIFDDTNTPTGTTTDPKDFGHALQSVTFFDLKI